MSVKRQATTELNHENWDQDDPADHEDMGTFKTAPKEEIEKRVIRTAKRRSHNAAGSETKAAVFKSFGGFNKAPPSSFDFLANLTNGSKPNGNSLPKNDNTPTSGLLPKPLASSTCQISVSSPSMVTSEGMPTQPNSWFGNSSGTLFSATKKDSASSDSPFKPSTTGTITSSSTGFTASLKTTTHQVSPSIFGIQSASTAGSLFSNSNESKEQKGTTATTPAFGSNTLGTKSPEKKSDNNSESLKDDPHKLEFYSKLKGLNLSVLDWIKKHVNETPLCILTPIFNDYEKYLKEIQDEYEKNKQVKQSEDTTKRASTESASSSLFSSKQPTLNAGSLFSGFKPPPTSESKPLSAFSAGNSLSSNTNFSLGASNPSGFSFGINKDSENTSPFATKSKTTESNSPFGAKGTENNSPFGAKTTESNSSFGAKTTDSNSPFGIKITESNSPFGAKTASSAAPFSFGIGQPFSFSPSTQNPPKASEEDKKDDNEDDEPPKVEFTPIVEKNSVYEKKCKVFLKKGDGYVDKGVGTLYLKKLESGKHQLLVRANTSLGNVLLNFILSAELPTQRMGNNNVMVVCIPTPDAMPPPAPALIRVKTSAEADELLEVLNKHKA